MDWTPLLPITSGKNWAPKDSGGIHAISNLEFQRNLCENYYQARDFGTPAILGWAIAFKQRLEMYINDGSFEETFQLWTILLKGLYFDLIKIRHVELAPLGIFGTLLKSEFPDEFRFGFLTYNEKIIGFTCHELGFIPGARIKQSLIDEIEAEIYKKDIEKATDYFSAWVHTFDDKNLENLLFYSLIYQVASEWDPEFDTKIDIDLKKIFEIEHKLWLAPEGELLELDVSSPALPVYMGTPIICETCDYQIGKEHGALEVHQPDDCRCPKCGAAQDWLEKYESWLHFSDKKGCYLIYAFESSPIRRPPFSNYITFHDDGVEIKSGPVNLKVYGLVFSEEAMKCNRLMFFRDDGSEITTSLPIKGEYYGLVDLVKQDKNPRVDRITGEYIAILEVEGWDENIPLRYPAQAIEREEALLLTWPNFKLEGWHIYYYLLESTPAMHKAGLGLRALRKREGPLELDSNRGQLNEMVDAFEIVFKDKKTDNMQRKMRFQNPERWLPGYCLYQ